jgi:hypothetical protein
MKSEKAKKYLFENGLGYPYTGYVTEQAAERAVELAGAKAQYEELARWHDPKEELPEYIKVVEVKYKAFNKIMMAIAFRLGDLWSGENKWCIDGTSVRIDHENILGWREIHE